MTLTFVAKGLAQDYMNEDRCMDLVYRIEHPTEVRLIAVTEAVPRAASRQVSVVRSAPDPPDCPYPVVLARLHPDDWIRRRAIDWPDGLDPKTNSGYVLVAAIPSEGWPARVWSHQAARDEA